MGPNRKNCGLAVVVLATALAWQPVAAATPLEACQTGVAGVLAALAAGAGANARVASSCRMNYGVAESALLDVLSVLPAGDGKVAGDVTACTDRLRGALSKLPFFKATVGAGKQLPAMCRQAEGHPVQAALFVTLGVIRNPANHRCAVGLGGLLDILNVKPAERPAEKLAGARCSTAKNDVAQALKGLMLGELAGKTSRLQADKFCPARLHYVLTITGLAVGKEAAAAKRLCRQTGGDSLTALAGQFGHEAAKANARARLRTCAETLAKVMKLLRVPVRAANPKNLVTACVRAKGSASLATHTFLGAMIATVKQRGQAKKPAKPAK